MEVPRPLWSRLNNFNASLALGTCFLMLSGGLGVGFGYPHSPSSEAKADAALFSNLKRRVPSALLFFEEPKNE
jgi:hypothetical protein